jgi:hypothetical protein
MTHMVTAVTLLSTVLHGPLVSGLPYPFSLIILSCRSSVGSVLGIHHRSVYVLPIPAAVSKFPQGTGEGQNPAANAFLQTQGV